MIYHSCDNQRWMPVTIWDEPSNPHSTSSVNIIPQLSSNFMLHRLHPLLVTNDQAPSFQFKLHRNTANQRNHTSCGVHSNHSSRLNHSEAPKLFIHFRSFVFVPPNNQNVFSFNNPNHRLIFQVNRKPTTLKSFHSFSPCRSSNKKKKKIVF